MPHIPGAPLSDVVPDVFDPFGQVLPLSAGEIKVLIELV